MKIKTAVHLLQIGFLKSHFIIGPDNDKNVELVW